MAAITPPPAPELPRRTPGRPHPVQQPGSPRPKAARWPRRLAASAALLLASAPFALAACTHTPEIPPFQPAAEQLLSALQSGSLDGVNIDHEPAANPQAQLEEMLNPLLTATGQDRPQVSLGAVTEAEPQSATDTRTATAQLHWTWPFGDAERPADWQYDTQANFVYTPPAAGQAPATSDWHLAWDSDLLLPGYVPGTQIAVKRSAAQRADILDQAGEPLVKLRPVARLGIDKAAVIGHDHYDEETLADSARQLVALVGASGYTYDPDAFVARVAAAGPRAFVDLITLREDDTSVDLAAAQQIPAVSAVPGNLPLAPTSTFARAILGRAGEATAELIEKSAGRWHAGDVTGLSGLQQRYNDQLAGLPGITVTATAPGGMEQVLFDQAPIDGTALSTTFDVALQTRAEQVLADVAPAAAVVAIRPSTGEIVAAASGPGSTGHDTALLGQAAPGSTFKVVDALAFARHGITADSVVPCTPTIVVDGRTFANVPEYPADALGDVPLRTAFAHSCNTAFISQAATVSQADLVAAARDLGFEIATPIGTPAFYGEIPADADAAQHAATLLGQDRVLASPFTMARVAASVAAGHRVDPVLVRATGGAADNPAEASNLTEAEAAAVRDLMSAVVAEGSAAMLQDIPGIVGAKTGTAQFGDGSQNHTWMIAITDSNGPDGDLAVAVFVDEGERGASTSGPLMHAFLRG